MDPEVIKALAHALRLEILELIAAKPRNAKEIAWYMKRPVKLIAYHLSVMEQGGCVRAVDPEEGDSGEHVFEVAEMVPSLPSELPAKVRAEAIAAVLKRLLVGAAAAVDGKTRVDLAEELVRCEAGALDDQGIDETMEIVTEATEKYTKVLETATVRLVDSGKPGVPVTVAFAAFQSSK